MANTDFYQTLGVPRTASADEIRKAYRTLSRKYHPDMNPDDKKSEAKFKEIQHAFDILGDEEKRRKYDQFGEAFTRHGPQGQPQSWTSGGGSQFDFNDLFGGQVDLGDIFGGAFGGGGARRERRPRPSPGRDLELEVTIPFHLAATGGEYPLSLQQNGKTETLAVKIPPGVDTGSKIRLAGQGEQGQTGGPAGDLHLKIRVTPHPYFKRDGNNLLLDLPITISEAVLGAQMEVPTLSEGLVSLKVPPGTSSGTRLRLKGKGIPDRKTRQTGDQFMVIKIVVPRELTNEARQLIHDFGEKQTLEPRKGIWNP